MSDARGYLHRCSSCCDAVQAAAAKLWLQGTACRKKSPWLRQRDSPFLGFQQATTACRGFAFLEFVTKQEAKVAMDSVAGAHLYGRRLVIEWAQQGEDGLDDIRAKTAAKFRGEGVAEFDELPVVKKQKRMM